MSVGFTYSALLIDKKDLQFGFLRFVTEEPTALNYSSIVVILAAIAGVAIILFGILLGRKSKGHTQITR
ncbi:hypothetical protein [Paenibacillus odorifer]|nr:hypothetical protein [Paenibacillus odorifer]